MNITINALDLKTTQKIYPNGELRFLSNACEHLTYIRLQQNLRFFKKIDSLLVMFDHSTVNLDIDN